MKRFAATLSLMAVTAILAGCSTVSDTPSSEGPEPIDLSRPAVIADLCGDGAQDILDFVTERAEAPVGSGLRKQLEAWGVDDPTDDEYIATILDRVNERAETKCDDSSDDEEDQTDTTTVDDPTVAECAGFKRWLATLDPEVMEVTYAENSVYVANMGRACAELIDTANVLGWDGTITNPEIYYGDGGTTVVDTTQDPNTPPLLDGALRYQNLTRNWGDLVERVGDQQWYKDGLDEFEVQSGFGWDEVEKFAEIEEEYAAEDIVLETRVIFVQKRSDMSDVAVRDAVRPYLGDDADTLDIYRVDQAIMDTYNTGTSEAPHMEDFAHDESMVRVTLVPFLLDSEGNPVVDENGIPKLDLSRGAGVFIDCGNLHWNPPIIVTTCTDETCLPVCPPWFPHGWPGLCKDDPSRDPEPEGHNWPGGGGWSPGTGGAGATSAAAGDPPVTYVWTPPVVAGIPAGSTPDASAPPATIEGDDPATPQAPATECVPGFGTVC